MTITVMTLGGDDAILTSDRSESSYGIPVLIIPRPTPQDLEETYGYYPAPDDCYDRPLSPMECGMRDIQLHPWTANLKPFPHRPGSVEAKQVLDAARKMAEDFNRMGDPFRPKARPATELPRIENILS